MYDGSVLSALRHGYFLQKSIALHHPLTEHAVVIAAITTGTLGTSMPTSAGVSGRRCLSGISTASTTHSSTTPAWCTVPRTAMVSACTLRTATLTLRGMCRTTKSSPLMVRLAKARAQTAMYRARASCLLTLLVSSYARLLSGTAEVCGKPWAEWFAPGNYTGRDKGSTLAKWLAPDELMAEAKALLGF